MPRLLEWVHATLSRPLVCCTELFASCDLGLGIRLAGVDSREEVPIQAASVVTWIGSSIEGSSFSGLLTRVEIGHIRFSSAENGRIRLRGSGSSPSEIQGTRLTSRLSPPFNRRAPDGLELRKMAQASTPPALGRLTTAFSVPRSRRHAKRAPGPLGGGTAHFASRCPCRRALRRCV